MPVEVSLESKLLVSDEQAQLLFTLRDLIGAGERAFGRIQAQGEFHQAVTFLVGMAVASGQTLHSLCVIGRAQQARPIARAIVENLINAHYIARDPARRAGRFWAYRPIPHALAAEARFKLFGVAVELDEVRGQAADAKRALGSDKWTTHNIRARAQECNLLPVWELHYREASAFAHGDSSTWNAFVSDDGKAIVLGPSSEGIEAVVPGAVSALFGALALLGYMFDDRVLIGELRAVSETLPANAKKLDLRSHYESIRSAST